MQLGQVVADVAVAAKYLHGSVGGFERNSLHLIDRERGFAQRVVALVEFPGGFPGQKARAVDLDRHVGELERDGLLLRDLRAEGLALFRVIPRHLERGARDADTARSQRDAPARDQAAHVERGEPRALGHAHAAQRHVCERQRRDAHRRVAHSC